MSRLIFTFIFIAYSLQTFGQTEDLFELNIIHFNDFHARFEETSKTSAKCIPEQGECIGGIARLYTAIAKLKKKAPEAVVLDAGDNFLGTLWYNTLRWNVTQYFMNLLPMDAHTFGNHEFDHGIGDLVDYLNFLKAPMVACNIDDSLEPTMKGLFHKSVIIERKGERIGIIGVIITTTRELSNVGRLILKDEINSVKEEADSLSRLGVNKIIVLSHCGLDIDRKIAMEAGDNIDVIVGGHTHSLLYNGNTPSGDTAVDVYPVVMEQATGTKVLIVQAMAFTKYLGDLTVRFDGNGKIQNWHGSPHYLNKDFAQDPDILERLKPFREIVDAEGLRIIGWSKVLLTQSPCGSGECNLGNFITDGFVHYVTQFSQKRHWTYAAIGLINKGGLRTDIPRGRITYEDLIISQPFGNMIQTIDLQGKYILETLEHSVNTTTVSPFFSNNFLQVSGLKLTYDVRKPPGKRVVEALVRCAKCSIPRYSPLNPDEVYKIVTQRYLIEGNDGFTAISKNMMNLETWSVDEVVTETYIKKESPILHGNEQRIIVIQ